jgi:NAD(P)-dependent dehydrogenase (short-subunit alcohol dehydrogenase family)
MKDLADRVAWITGGASGIGLALAHRLAAERVKLALVDVEEAPLREAESALRAAGATVLALRADVGKASDMEAATRETLARFGVVHLIVNNAGVGGGGGPMWQLSESDWRWALDVNLWGVIHAIRLLVPPLLASGLDGHIVNTASIAGLTSTPFMGPYTATKHAVVAISECLAKELELAKAKVGVSVLCPGFVKTKIGSSQRNRPREEAGTEVTPQMKQFQAVLAQLVDTGVSADAIAATTLEAVREGRFYVLTHPELTPAIEHRMTQILEQRQPGIDPMFRSLFGAKS